VVQTVDSCRNLPDSVIISKDAKAIVPASNPVQRPGRSWKKKELPDLTWDQSRTYALTPKTFLFVETKAVELSKNTSQLPTEGATTVEITRGGQRVTFLYLSFFEPDNTIKCLKEILLLVSKPFLDGKLRDEITGELKREFVFVVDNGLAEQPSSYPSGANVLGTPFCSF